MLKMVPEGTIKVLSSLYTTANINGINDYEVIPSSTSFLCFYFIRISGIMSSWSPSNSETILTSTYLG